jgi:hypothetical protein
MKRTALALPWYPYDRKGRRSIRAMIAVANSKGTSCEPSEMNANLKGNTAEW